MPNLRRMQQTEQAAVDAVLRNWSDAGARSVDRLKAELRATPDGSQLAALAGADDLIAGYIDTLPGFRRVSSGGRGAFWAPVRSSTVKTGTILGRESAVSIRVDYRAIDIVANPIRRRG